MSNVGGLLGYRRIKEELLERRGHGGNIKKKFQRA